MKNINLVFSFLIVFFLSGGSNAMHSRTCGSWLFLRFTDVMAELESTPNHEKERKKELRVEALTYLMQAAQLRDPEAMTYVYRDLPVIQSLVALIDPTTKNRSSLASPLKELIEKGNSFAAQCGLTVYPNLNSDQRNLLFGLIDKDQNPVMLHKVALSLEAKGEFERALLQLEEPIRQGFLVSLKRKAGILYKLGGDRAINESNTIRRNLVDQYEFVDEMNNLGISLATYPQFETFPNEHKYWLNRAAYGGNIPAMSSYAAILSKDHQFADARAFLDMARKTLDSPENKKLDHEWRRQLSESIAANHLAIMIEEREYNSGISEGERKVQTQAYPARSSQKAKRLTVMLRENRRYLELLDHLVKYYEETNLEESEDEENKNEDVLKTSSDEDSDEPVNELKEKQQPIGEEGQIASVLPEKPTACTKLTSLDHTLTSSTSDGTAKKATRPDPTTRPNAPTNKEKEIRGSASLRKNSRNVHRKHLKEPKNTQPKTAHCQVTNDNQEFLLQLGQRLKRVRSIIERLLSHQTIDNKDIRAVLNRLKVKKPNFVRGTHNSVEMNFDESHRAKKTLITAHKNSSPHTNSNKLREIFHQFGIKSASQLWQDL